MAHYKAPGELHFSKIVDLAPKIRAGEISSRICTELMLERIERFNPQLNAYITVCPEYALSLAKTADRELADGRDRGPLHGVPIAVKDMIATRGIRTTAGTKFLRDWVPEEDARVVSRLKTAGAVILGKTGMDELAWGSTSANPHYGDVRNPYDTKLHPGGSSGGSAAAVSAGLAYASVGTDTGCSIRQPAHCCGIVGFKPSFGRVSTRGVTPLVPSMDHVGPLARSVADAALLFDALSCPDQIIKPDFDPFGFNQDRGSIVGTRVGLIRQFFTEGGDDEVDTLFLKALDIFPSIGAEIVDIEVTGLEQGFAAARTMFYEVRDHYAQVWRDRPELLSDELRARIAKALRWGRERYEDAVDVRKRLRSSLDGLLEHVDALVAPTSTVAARPIGEPPERFGRERWKNTSIFNLTGLPSISVPCGYTTSGLPVGLMISGRPQDDASVLKIAFCFERAAAWHRWHPAGY